MSTDDWRPELPIPIPNLGGILRLGPDLRPRLFWQGQCGSDARPGYWCLSRLEANPSGDFRKRMSRGDVGPETADGIAWAEATLAEWDTSLVGALAVADVYKMEVERLCRRFGLGPDQMMEFERLTRDRPVTCWHEPGVYLVNDAGECEDCGLPVR